MEIDEFKFLVDKALELGCSDAKIIPSYKVVVENRVRLKCMVGCPNYGNNLKCPPYTPTVDEFRKVLNEYSTVMMIKFDPNEIKDEYDKLVVNNVDPDEVILNIEMYSPLKELWTSVYRNMLTVLLDLEKLAFKEGYTFATSFFGGYCPLCETCNIENGKCLNPTIARFACEAMGINLMKTANNAQIELTFKDPAPVAILLID